MAHYRGIDVTRIAQSIDDALCYVMKTGVGAETSRYIYSLIDGRKVAVVRQSSSNEEAVRNMKAMKLKEFFVPLRDLMQFQAVTDKSGEGLDIYKSLAAWGGFSGGKSIVSTGLSREIEAYIQNKTAAENLAYDPRHIGKIEQPFHLYAFRNIHDGQEPEGTEAEKLYIKLEDTFNRLMARDELMRVMVDIDGLVMIATRYAASQLAAAAPAGYKLIDGVTGRDFQKATPAKLPVKKNAPKR